jgi:hypothetical protein
VGPLGFPEIVILSLMFIGPVVIGLGGLLLYRLLLGRRATRLGYTSTAAYLRAAPRSDAEKRDATDLALKGLVFCGLGLIFPPFILVGLIPLFYGGRKLAYASMGLGLVDDAEQPGP